MATPNRSNFTGTQPSRILAAAAALLALAGCQEKEVYQPEGPRPVRYAEAQLVSSGGERIFSGSVRAADASRLSFRVPGRVVARPVEIGARFERGDLLARLDPADYRLRVEQGEAALERARASAREADSELRRVRALYAGDNATRGELDRALAAAQRTVSGVAEAERGLEMARRQLGYTRLTASYAGVVTDLFVEAGENVQAAQAVAAVARGGGSGDPAASGLEVEWSLPEVMLDSLALGDSVAVAFPALGEGARTTATLTELGAAPRAGEATFPAIARLDSAMARVRQGMSAEIRIVLPDEGGDAAALAGGSAMRVVVPAEAVAADPRGRYVFVIDQGAEASTDGAEAPGEVRLAVRREVQVGRLSPQGLEIRSGLGGGETVVTAGVTFLDDGQKVRLLRGDPLAELPSLGGDAPAQGGSAPGDATDGAGEDR
ncbi:MAG: efflux RND transporter periplasmic adaptor subunit [Acidobacteriota bacterium]